MDCYQHPGTTSTATCVSCAQPICPKCREEVAGHAMCRPCVAAASARFVDAAGPSAGTPTAAAFASAPVSSAPDDAAAIGMPVGQSVGPMASLSADYGAAPGFIRRVGRGAFWGLIYGQWWTVLMIFWSFVWGHGGVSVGAGISLVVFFGFFGCLAGLIIGIANLSYSRGAIVGVSVGILVCLIEMAQSHDAGALLDLVFFFFTGRFVGAGITRRVQQPVK